MNCIVCFTSDKKTFFKLGIVEGTDYHVPFQSGCIMNGIVQTYECHDYLFWSGTTIFGDQPQTTIHEFFFGEDDHHFSMHFVNKVVGPHLPSDKEDAVN
jgi:hypothetical protein